MSNVYRPGVRVVLGFSARGEVPKEASAAAATAALQKAVTSLGKDWKRVAPLFVVAPAAGSGRLAIGLAISRVPLVLDAPRMLAPNTAIAREHYVVQSSFANAPDVDKYGNTQADAGILMALAAGANDPALAGLTLDDPGPDPAYFLVSEDGRAGAVVYGQVLWKLGGAYEGDGVRTWTRDYGGGEGVRLVGVPYAEVGPDAPIMRIDATHPSRAAHSTRATKAVRALLDTQAAWNWELVCDVEPGPFVPEPTVAAPKAAVKARVRAKKPATKQEAQIPSKTFVMRRLATCVASLTSLGDGAEVAPQTLEDVGVLRAYSHDDLASAPDHSPHAAIYELRDPPDSAALADPSKLFARPSVREALATWNASARGRWAAGAEWIIADVELVSEQEDEAFDARVSAIIALFAVEGGWAAAVWPSSRHEELATVLGFDAWARAEWRECAFWLGE